VLKSLQQTVCPKNFEFFHFSAKVRFLSDGRLYVDDGREANVYDSGEGRLQGRHSE
jgi:hypothetical protein